MDLGEFGVKMLGQHKAFARKDSSLSASVSAYRQPGPLGHKQATKGKRQVWGLAKIKY
jgi:hypothetical protein